MARPIGVEYLSAGTVQPLIGVCAEIVPLGLQQVGRQPLGGIAVKIAEGGGHGGNRHAAPGGGGDDGTPRRQQPLDRVLEIGGQQQIGHRPGQRRDGHAPLGMLEVAGIYRHRLCPAHAGQHHGGKTDPINVPQRVQGQAVVPLGRGVAQKKGGDAVAGLVQNQAEQHRRHTQQRVPQRADVQSKGITF